MLRHHDDEEHDHEDDLEDDSDDAGDDDDFMWRMGMQTSSLLLKRQNILLVR